MASYGTTLLRLLGYGLALYLLVHGHFLLALLVGGLARLLLQPAASSGALVCHYADDPHQPHHYTRTVRH